MNRGSGTGYIPDKSNLMSSTLTMLEFFKDGEKAFSSFSAFLESNYDIRSSNTVRMTFTTLCKWKLLYEVDFKTYALTDTGADLLKTHSETSLGRQIQNSTLYFGEILQELETEVLTGSALKQAANQRYGMSFKSSSDLSCRTQYLLGLSFIERSSKKYRITSQGRDFLQLLKEEGLLSECINKKPYKKPELNNHINLELPNSFLKKCQKQKLLPEFVLHELMTYYADNKLSLGIQSNEKRR
jgi:DNA-binding PadR family transcriptional regulator